MLFIFHLWLGDLWPNFPNCGTFSSLALLPELDLFFPLDINMWCFIPVRVWLTCGFGKERNYEKLLLINFFLALLGIAEQSDWQGCTLTELLLEILFHSKFCENLNWYWSLPVLNHAHAVRLFEQCYFLFDALHQFLTLIWIGTLHSRLSGYSELNIIIMFIQVSTNLFEHNKFIQAVGKIIQNFIGKNKDIMGKE